MDLIPLDNVQMGNRIRRQREALGYSREQLAEKLDITAKFLGDIEYGNKGISIKNFTSLIQLLNVSADYLLLGTNNPQKKELICEVRYYINLE